ncbi:MAG: hypothetical protein HYY01_03605 [Chloroflexi bacterium]|nr:hypothetical protein [Chloroflexota bacterium]
MATNLKRTTVFLTPELHERLRRLAFENRTSIAALMREATLEFLEEAEDIHLGAKAQAEEEYVEVYQ